MRRPLRALWAGIAVIASAPAPTGAETLAELAAAADLIAVVRVERTDYLKTRGFPSGGSAFLKVLIPYRGAARDDWLEVTEQGLRDDACYYPEPGAFEFEGSRFLVFLKRAPGAAGTYRGRAPGCRLPVLVTAANGYALRYPVAGLEVNDPDAVAELSYVDPAAYVDAADFTSAQLRELTEVWQARAVPSDDPLAPPRARYVYTRGIPIERLRALMFPE